VTENAASHFTMPELGSGVTEATIVRWLREPGEYFEAQDPLLEVATDKVDTEIPAPQAGVLIEVLAEADAVVSVGAPLAVIALPGQAPSGPPSREPSVPATPVVARQPLEAPSAPTPVVASPRLEGASAPGEAAPTPSVAQINRPRGDRVERLAPIRKAIARRMMESVARAAQLTTVVEADVTFIAQLREQQATDFVRRVGVPLSFLPFFAKAAVEALIEFPVVNASLDEAATQVTYFHDVHLGIAVDSDRGLMVPVLREATHLSIAELALRIARAADGVRAGTIKPDEQSGGTFTITNTGSRGALFDTPIINPPQSAILGTGAVVSRVVPTARRGEAVQFGVRSMVYLALSYDHRLIDGADAARFLTAIKARLENGLAAKELL
jgi:2-oxoglutarate dehydrogenase E2 component (dihydrolipoamide succinyltransferase)